MGESTERTPTDWPLHEGPLPKRWSAQPTYAQSHLFGRNKHRRTPEYESFCSMLQRCYQIQNRAYPDYGGRGIRVWIEFVKPDTGCATLVSLIGPRPKDHTLDRIDTNGHYVPGNIRWASGTTQSRNRRKYDLGGKSRTPYKGVRVFKYKKKTTYQARLGVGDHLSDLGSFTSAEEAAIVFDVQARELGYEPSVLNFPHWVGGLISDVLEQAARDKIECADSDLWKQENTHG